MTAPPPPGELWLRSSARPALGAGDYRLELGQRIHEGDPGRPIGSESVVRSLRVTAPRFTLPGTEVHGVFPPPNSTGAFQNRLAQIALRRKTLPWERSADGGPPATRPPWLALVLLADGEANFLSGVAVADAMPDAVRSRLGVMETGTCDALEVSSTVVGACFPHADELDLLCHVRQINLEEGEFAGTDDDGYLAVVVSNRLPQAGQRYGAYLISLEGQIGELPPRPAAAPVDDIAGTRVYDVSDATLRAASFRANPAATIGLEATTQPTAAAAGMQDVSAWQAPPPRAADGSAEPLPTAAAGRGFIRNDVDFEALHAAIGEPPPRLLRFPVLAHWSFSCTLQGDFQSLAAGLDVGLLGTAPEPRPDAVPPGLRVTDTGHTIVDRITRRGERTTSWYRGAFTPREVKRRPARGTGTDDPRARGPYHVADQALRVDARGAVDISEAAAFELGRLLALADPVYAATLHGWRRAALAARRLATLNSNVPGLSEVPDVDGQLARALGAALVTAVSTPDPSVAAGAGAGTPLGPRVLPFDVEGIVTPGDAAVIAAGLGVPQALVDDVLSPGITQTGLPRESPDPKVPSTFEEVVAKKEQLFHLQDRLYELRAQLLEEAEVPPGSTWSPR